MAIANARLPRHLTLLALVVLPALVAGTRCGVKPGTAHLPNSNRVVPMDGSDSWLCDGNWAFLTYKVRKSDITLFNPKRCMRAGAHVFATFPQYYREVGMLRSTHINANPRTPVKYMREREEGKEKKTHKSFHGQMQLAFSQLDGHCVGSLTLGVHVCVVWHGIAGRRRVELTGSGRSAQKKWAG